MSYDVIVIGAGLGGLTAGAKLAKEGKKVLVLEQHDRPGGCATTFRRRDFIMEVGLHEMDGLHSRDIKNRIFRDLDITGRVDFLEVPEFYRFLNGRVDIVIPHQPEKAARVLKDRFPDQEKGIDTYFDHLLNARKITGAQGGEKDRSVGEFLDGIISDEDLKLVLLGNLGYFHDDPYSLSLFYYLNAQGSYYGGRANFIRGGSRALSEALSSIIEENQGAVRLNSLVTSIDYEGSTPAGVTWKRYRGKEQGTFSEKAPEIIMNGAVPNLAGGLLSEADAANLTAHIGNNRIGASLLTVYFGFNRPLKEINRHYSTFIFDESVRRLS
jgi:all-trans-retinol 13,14-reductase